MTLDQVTNFFGSLYQATEALGIARSNITKWRKKGYIPYQQQYRLEEITNGELKRDEYTHRRGKARLTEQAN